MLHIKSKTDTVVNKQWEQILLKQIERKSSIVYYEGDVSTVASGAVFSENVVSVTTLQTGITRQFCLLDRGDHDVVLPHKTGYLSYFTLEAVAVKLQH